MKTVWLIDDIWGYWVQDVFATRAAALAYLEDKIDSTSCYYKVEHYLRTGEIELIEVEVIE